MWTLFHTLTVAAYEKTGGEWIGVRWGGGGEGGILVEKGMIRWIVSPFVMTGLEKRKSAQLCVQFCALGLTVCWR